MERVGYCGQIAICLLTVAIIMAVILTFEYYTSTGAEQDDTITSLACSNRLDAYCPSRSPSREGGETADALVKRWLDKLCRRYDYHNWSDAAQRCRDKREGAGT